MMQRQERALLIWIRPSNSHTGPRHLNGRIRGRTDVRTRPTCSFTPDDFTCAQGGVHRCIITTAANAAVGPIHDRMPLVLEDVDWPLWLGEADGDPATLLRPPPDDLLMLRLLPAR
jgi:hypothetical protein